MSDSRRKYDAEFKRNAVMLVESGRSVSDVVDSLGIAANMLHRWRFQMRKQGQIAFPGYGNQALTDDQRKIKDLERQLKDAEMEREILKKALAIFSNAPK